MGAPPACAPPPPTGSNSLIFAYIFTEKHPRRRSAPPPNGLVPPNGKSWIGHCILYFTLSYYFTLTVTLSVHGNSSKIHCGKLYGLMNNLCHFSAINQGAGSYCSPQIYFPRNRILEIENAKKPCIYRF